MWPRAAAAAAKSRQSCLTLRDPMDCSLPGSSIHGIFQARVLEWGAIAFYKDTSCGLSLHSQVMGGSEFWRQYWEYRGHSRNRKHHGCLSTVGLKGSGDPNKLEAQRQQELPYKEFCVPSLGIWISSWNEWVSQKDFNSGSYMIIFAF